MTDVRINLLPWRQQFRERRQQDFLKALAGACLLGLALVAFGYYHYQRAIDRQQARNVSLQSEAARLDQRIDQLRQLQQQRGELLARMEAVQQLQGNRSVIVRIFHELAEQLAPGVWYTRVVRMGDEIRLFGVAESSKGISEQLRNLADSRWLARPNVLEITAWPDAGTDAGADVGAGAEPRASRFEIAVHQATDVTADAESSTKPLANRRPLANREPLANEGGP